LHFINKNKTKDYNSAIKNLNHIYVKLFLISLLFFALVLKNKLKLYKIKSKFYQKLKLLNVFQQNVINNYLNNISSKYELEKYQDAFALTTVYPLINVSEVSNTSSLNLMKLDLIKQLEIKKETKNISDIKIIYLCESFNFGNTMILLNNILFYSEILGIHNVYLNSEMIWPFKENISSSRINISLVLPSKIDLKNKTIIAFDPHLVYSQKVFRPEIRINELKDNIIKNLPKVYTYPEDLYIHIRGGDIFKYKSGRNTNYAQPPLCFYKSILYNYKFKNIYILSEDRRNPNIEKLINEFSQIIMTQNSMKNDLSLLLNAYNIVGSMSSFLSSIIIINNNLKNYWEYDIYRLPEKYWHLHHDIYKTRNKYFIYRMDASTKYKNKMFPWKNSKYQINLMLNENCSDFKIIPPFNHSII
jgi:hypothetical protein